MRRLIKNYLSTLYKLPSTNVGFTLIELLIVIAVIGALSTMFVSTYPGIRRRVRDTERKSDIAQYRNLLEIYANNKNGFYPTGSTPNIASKCGAGQPLGDVACPTPPQIPGLPAINYIYATDATGSRYVVYVRVEEPIVPNSFWAACSNGEVGETNGANIPLNGSCTVN